MRRETRLVHLHRVDGPQRAQCLPTIKDGYPPYWRSPETIKAIMIDNNVPMTHAYIKTGVGR